MSITRMTASSGASGTETAQDDAATLLTDGVHTGLTATYVDASNRVDLKITALPSATRTASYSIIAGDIRREQIYDSTSAGTFTLPTNTAHPIAVGEWIPLRQSNTGQLTVAAAGGVTLQARGGAFKLAGQHAVAEVRKTATDTWVLYGDITT